jgi:xanthine/CO dehydrogenase XdhC/CoxF family maturation factor
MKHWKETADVLARVLRLAEEGRRAAVATVVGIHGSAYRRPGAKFLVDEEGRTSGSISGGCLEGDVREVALEVMRTGTPRLLKYDTGGDDTSVFSLGLGCSGSVEIFVHSATSPGALDAAREALDRLSGDRAFSISTVLRGEAAGRMRVSDSAAGSDVEGGSPDPDVFVETLAPPAHLLVFGAGDDALPLCAYASDAGFRVTVVDHRAASLSAERFPAAFRLVERRPQEGLSGLPAGPRALAVVKTHSFAHDREWVRRLLEEGVPYVGLLGPRARGAKILEEIGANASDPAGERVFTPVGLDLGAEGPEQVALSIVAELLAVHSSRQPWSLREKEGAIHAG